MGTRNHVVRRQEALELVGEMELELLAAAAQAAHEGRVPTSEFGYRLWNQKLESKLALLKALRTHVLAQDGLETIAVAEGTA